MAYPRASLEGRGAMVVAETRRPPKHGSQREKALKNCVKHLTDSAFASKMVRRIPTVGEWIGDAMNTKTQVPIPVIRRLSHYLQYIRMQIEQGQEWVSSLELAEALEVTSSTVRQDLSWLDISGTAKRGYKIEDLESSILTLIGREQGSNVIIIGAGNLGRALALHEEFPRQGFAICGLFDSSRRVIGKKVGKLVVQSIDELPAAVRKKNVEIGVIAVPAKAAQSVADQLVSAGVQGVLNMSCVHVRTPNGVSVVEARMFSSLSLLSYAIKARKGTGR